MKLTSSKPARYAETIDKRKFIKLSSSRQHEYLAFLARKSLKTGDFSGFYKRYSEMQSWAELDHYSPPDYLTGEEALHEYFLFHNSFSSNPQEYLTDNNPVSQDYDSITWVPKLDVTVVLDQVRSPYNVGSVLRLIDNFGFRRLVHNSEWLRLDHPQLCRAARGCQNWIPVELKQDLVHWLVRNKLPVVGLETSPEAVTVDKWKPEQNCILIIGSEAYGIAKELRNCCKTLVKIPMSGFKKSMNLHHALSIAGHKIAASFIA